MTKQFKASLNGKSFDNLHEYASALEKAIREGGNIETHFSVNSSSVEEKCECENAAEPKKLESIKKYLPFSDEILSSEYIDIIFDAPGDESRNKRIDEIDRKNEKLHEEVCKAVRLNSNRQLTTYLEDVERVSDKLSTDIELLGGMLDDIKDEYKIAYERYEEAKNNLRIAEDMFNGEHELLLKYKDAIKLSKTLAHFYNSVKNCVNDEFDLRSYKKSL